MCIRDSKNFGSRKETRRIGKPGDRKGKFVCDKIYDDAENIFISWKTALPQLAVICETCSDRLFRAHFDECCNNLEWPNPWCFGHWSLVSFLRYPASKSCYQTWWYCYREMDRAIPSHSKNHVRRIIFDDLLPKWYNHQTSPGRKQRLAQAIQPDQTSSCIKHVPTSPRNPVRETKNQWTNIRG